MQLFDPTGKTALITGASSGLGERFAHCLSGAGARVLLAARRLDKLQILAHTIGNAVALEMDVANPVSVSAAFDQLDAAGEKINICINNAGIAKMTPVFGSGEQLGFEQMMQINVIGVWTVIRAVAHHMRQQGIHGSIINIGSINGDVLPAVMGTGYNVSKAAVLHMTRSLVDELSPYNIRINAVNPGFFPTPMTQTAYPNASEQWIEEVRKRIPLGFVPEVSDLDGIILYLASNRASRYVTGACLTIDGGMSYGKEGKA